MRSRHIVRSIAPRTEALEIHSLPLLSLLYYAMVYVTAVKILSIKRERLAYREGVGIEVS